MPRLRELPRSESGAPGCQGRSFPVGGIIESRVCDAIISRRTVARHAGGEGPRVGLISLPDSESAWLLLGAMLLSVATGVLAHADGSVALGTPHADQPTGEVFAHTSPVYEEVLGRPIRAREDTSYFLIWVD